MPMGKGYWDKDGYAVGKVAMLPTFRLFGRQAAAIYPLRATYKHTHV